MATSTRPRTLTPGQVDETRALAAQLARLARRLFDQGEVDDGVACTDAALKLENIARDAVEDWTR